MHRAHPVPLALVHDVQRDPAGHTGCVAEQVEHDGMLDDIHTRGRQHPRLQGTLDLGAGSVSAGVGDPVSVMSALAGQGQLPVPGAVEPGADGGELMHRRRTLPDQDAHRRLVTDPVARGDRVGEVLLRAVADA